MNLPLLQTHYTKTDIVKEKSQDTKEIEKNVTEIHELYNDVAILVQDQQTGLDNVEELVDESDFTIKKGSAELDKAKNYQNKARKKTCCISFIILLILATILIPIFSH